MNLTFRIYQKAVKRRSQPTGTDLAEFDRALQCALTGTGEHVHDEATRIPETRLVKR